jgi:carbon monoxide dehydrogenase subunit G
MDPITLSIRIDAPIQTVWDRIADVSTHGEWMGDVDSLAFEGNQRQGQGTLLVVATKVGPFRISDRMLFTEWNPPRQMTIDHQGSVKGFGEFRLSPVGGATEFVWTEELRFPWWLGGGLTAIVSRPILAAIWRRNLRRLKGLIDRT